MKVSGDYINNIPIFQVLQEGGSLSVEALLHVVKLLSVTKRIFFSFGERWLYQILMKLKEESEKTGLKFNIQKTKIMASGSITSWQIDGETMETVADFILGAPKSLQMVTAAMKLKDAYSLEEKLWPT